MEVILRKLSIFLAVLVLAAVFFPQSRASEIPENPSVIELPNEAVSKKILENGLVILTKESQPQNLTAINVRIRAGSSLEEEYLGSGISHLAEHMLFKGTKTRGPGAIEKEIKSYGGFINGSVDQDMTEYSIVVPSTYLSQALSLLKDMLANAAFDEAEMEKEKEVILKELRLDNDEPQNLLVRFLDETAYLRHTYKYPPIGYEEKFRDLKRDDIVKYYNRMYAPNRMALAIVGSLDRDAALSMAESEFKDFRSPNYAVIGLCAPEPVQIDKRYAEKKIETNLAYLAIGCHSTSVLNEDLFAMDVLSMILGRGNNSRLNTSLLKQSELVHSISCWNFTPRDPGLFVITAVLAAEKLPDARKAVEDEIAKVRSGGASDDELEGAKKMVLGDFIFGLQTIDAQAGELTANYILTGSYDFSRRYVKGIQAVSGEDIKRSANKYLRDDGVTVVELIPQSFKKPPGETAESVSAKEAPLRTLSLPNGLRIAIRQNKKTPTVSITAAVGGGLAVESKADNGIANLAARMLLKGTSGRKETEITGAIEKLGGSIDAFSGFNSFGINVEFLKPDMDTAISLLRDIFTNSQFPPEEFNKERSLVLAMIRAEDDDIFRRGINAFREEIFGSSPYALRYLGEEDSVRSLTREAAVSYYKKYVIPGNIVISVSGDLEPDIAADKLTKAFSDMEPKEVPGTKFKQAFPDKINVKTILMEKEQSFVALGFMTTDIKDPDKYALEALGSILSGYSGRLFNALRDKLPLAYTLGCVQRAMADTGFFALYAATTKDKIPAVEKGLIEEIAGIRKNGVTDEELIMAKRELAVGRDIKMQANSFFSQTTALDELYGLGYEDIFKYEGGINKVTKEDLKRVCDKYFNLDIYSEVIISSEK